MYTIVQKRRIYFLFSSLLILFGLVTMGYNMITAGTPLRLAVDFTGGAMWELRFEQPVSPIDVRQIFAEQGLPDTIVQTVGDDNTILIRTKDLDDEEKRAFASMMQERFGPSEELIFRSVGPAVGREVTQAAIIAVVVASVAILAFMVLAFRQLPHPVRYGACAIVAMVHDVLIMSGFFAVMGVIAGWEVDALFLTAALTVIGFSVNDTIVVYDRIRENLPRRRGEDLETVANRSLLETLHRSLATSLSAMFVLVALLLFGGTTITQFVAVLLVGMIAGTYSSIFVAVPMLVAWENGELFGSRRRAARAATA